ncbi:hypothetical protein HGB07_09125, partial [Candidatus Roizmanbacteria bacterium]|nr:hypothetical protein [Candidatus Roizmanbacteria bacterium]
MDIIFLEFEQDLNRVRKLIQLLDQIKGFAGIDLDVAVQELESSFFTATQSIHNQARSCHADTYVLYGTIVLYLGGRFEFFVRTVFEDLCIRIATRVGSFYKLPKIMQENLIKFTAEVMLNPRKYGHADRGVKAFISNLASNLDETQLFSQINASCLSITYENMRASTLSELFERIGVKDIWQKIGQQAKVQIFFETAEADQAKNKATSQLNTFVELRNQIAHPSTNMTWPNTDQVVAYIDFLKVIATAITELISVYEINL